jgi:UDP-N-acetylmuramoylalanine--D-glutamate ligase
MEAAINTMTHEAFQHVIVGLGKTGLSVARYLSRQGQGFAVVDSRQSPPGMDELNRDYPDTLTHFGNFDTDLIAEAVQMIVSPGVSVHTPEIARAVKSGAEIVGDVELFARAVTKPVIAITGSNGKSTVTALVGEMARAAGVETGVGGNIGTPALDLLDITKAELFVLELSSFQLETTESLRPVAAVVLNLSADHMDRYEDLDAYARAKGSIYHQAQVCIVNRDDPLASSLAHKPNPVSFGLDAPETDQDYGLIAINDEAWLVCGNKPIMKASGIRMPGRHNTANVLAAMALAAAAGIPLDVAAESARTFAGLAHRCEWVAESNGVAWFNDSKGTNVGATIAALNGLLQTVVLIAGGQGKGADFSSLQAAVRNKARSVILFGEDAGLIEMAIKDVVPVERVASLEEAVSLAASKAQSGDAVLFSPACASFDMFSDYQQRGETFVRLVKEVLS